MPSEKATYKYGEEEKVGQGKKAEPIWILLIHPLSLSNITKGDNHPGSLRSGEPA